MDFISTLRTNSEKLQDNSIVTLLWKEIIEGKPCHFLSEQIIQYSFHYPVDTDIYLQELHHLFEQSLKEDLRNIDGNLKAYLITFLYYCITASDRISLNTSLYASTLYIKITSLSSGLGQIFFEKNVYRVVLQLCINSAKKLEFPELTIELMQLIHEYCMKNSVEIGLFRGTCNVFSRIVMNTVQEKRSGASADKTNITTYSLNCIRELVLNTEDPDKLKAIMCGMLSCLRSTPFQNLSNTKKMLSVDAFRLFIKSLLNDLDETKIQYLLDSFFIVWGENDFDSPMECVEILNALDEKYYKDILIRISNYLNSKNHKNYHIHLMDVIYEMFANLPTFAMEKTVLVFSCMKCVIMHFLDNNKQIQERAVETVAKIFSIEDCVLVDSMFEVQKTTGKLATLDPNIIISALCVCAKDPKWTGVGKIKYILIVVSKILMNTLCIEAELSSVMLASLLKECTPYALKPLIPLLHELYVKLSTRKEKIMCKTILNVFLKNALHQDATAQAFVQHLYTSLISSSTIDGAIYSQQHYIQLFLTPDFDYNSFFNKCAMLIKHDHVTNLLSIFDYRIPGHRILLQNMLNHVCYKESGMLLQYVLDYFSDICMTDDAGAIFYSFSIILNNKTTYTMDELPRIDVLHGLLWEALFEQDILVSNVKAAYELIETLRGHILKLNHDEEQCTSLFRKTCEKALKTCTLKYDIGSIMYLTEMCLVMKRIPEDNVLDFFKRMLETPQTSNLIKSHHKDYLIQMLTFFATIAVMSKAHMPFTIELLLDNLNSDNVVVKVIALKLMYTLCSEVTQEYEEVSKFVLSNTYDKDPCLARISVVILERLIHESFVLLTPTYFFKFIFRLGCKELHTFMKSTLDKRFIVSHKNDIGKYYMSSVVFLSDCTQLDHYGAPSADFQDTLDRIRCLIDDPNPMLSYLFNAIPIKTKFNILLEITTLALDKYILGRFTIDQNVFSLLDYCLCTFEAFTNKNDTKFDSHYYSHVCKLIEKHLLGKDGKHAGTSNYGEYERQIKTCTLSLLKCFFYVEDGNLQANFKSNIGDILVAWIEHMTPEIVHYIHHEKAKEFKPYLSRLVEFMKNKQFPESVELQIDER